MFAISKAADLNQSVQGGLLYKSFPFNKSSLDIAALVAVGAAK
jgi:hypothetical protein